MIEGAKLTLTEAWEDDPNTVTQLKVDYSTDLLLPFFLGLSDSEGGDVVNSASISLSHGQVIKLYNLMCLYLQEPSVLSKGNGVEY